MTDLPKYSKPPRAVDVGGARDDLMALARKYPLAKPDEVYTTVDGEFVLPDPTEGEK